MWQLATLAVAIEIGENHKTIQPMSFYVHKYLPPYVCN